MKLEEKLLEQYFDVIEKNGNTENQIQEFLEENTIFIHTATVVGQDTMISP